jgi:magnesium chelatase subunit D
VTEAGRRTLSRDALAAAHAQFAELSPAVGELDERTLAAALSRDADAAVAALADMATATDPALRRQARQLARRLLPRLGAVGPARRRGTRRLVSQVGGLDGDLDLDRVLERSGGARPRGGDELVTRRFADAPRAVCLLVDRSGSMGGHAVALAAVAASAVLSAGSPQLRCGVIAFASEAMVLRDPWAGGRADRVIEDLLALRGHGRTDVAGALRAAATLLQSVPPGGRTVILLSDCLHTTGADPLPAAGLLDCLHVLGTSEDADARAAGQALARRGRGRWRPARSVGELAANLQLALR